MNLYYTDSKGHKSVVASDIATPQDALMFMMNNSKTRFTIPKGKINIHVGGTNRFSFNSADGKSLGYTLEA